MEYLWLLFALLSAFTAALVGIFGKIGLAGLDTNTATAIRAVIMALFLIIVVLIEGKLTKVGEIFANRSAMFYIVLSGIAGALSWMFYFLALKLGKVSQVIPIDRLSIVFAIILAVLFLGEKLSWKVGVGTALMAAGAIVIALP
jgi:bacterial/archaeal transporter family protein